MKLPRYEDHEKDFLAAMATKFGFTGKNLIVFLLRFCEKDAESNDRTLADEWQGELLEGTKKEEKNPNDTKKSVDAAAAILRDRLQVICDKLKDEGCDFGKTERGRWKIGKAWLQKVKFPEWAKEQGLIKPRTIEECWNELKTKVENSQPTKAGEIQSELIVEKWEPRLSGMGARRNIKRQQFPANSDLTYRVISPQVGHLILFEREPNGTIVCLCPSEFARSSYHAGKETKLPHADSEDKFFGSDELGWEQLLAVITPELPPFQWLEDSRQKALEVNQEHLAEILDYLNGQTNAEVLYTEYLVVAA
ncbi:MAG: DUF4384 domain-containing protein [Microcoleus sp. PH2017_29_MFU_D_A]|uniref:DUF4384 domain-containing protein n=1 Tax=unclassified Microcoleus TaxID=2642155 RepID=UPI001D32C0E1|nr:MULTISPECIES: DUF4384 domain-containing protein [unclassified Microcoleus]MCC3445313.1 DUF4384 domain-containing protein [Microcoleus sp. PH2017_03_ELD_O_A]MCC3506031.1 DUF4384 domain-containing protein [Microcoleus sp. PH2017_19_SFW_U_A]MCC3513267.1 DUF4384 domain-containing protein [Microcoleus sp. PH2017_17_BER_D_A]TAG88818.1 MAG: DUF4384 domain-containing protein [Oscillatoriales cyanobacterium]MCC3474892.1 DUF4384 domain-containing protein [Microcoleus sp. PH2017_13_LAR_U_A]